jgi:hypothetical protein
MQGGPRSERHTLPLHLQKEKTARRSIREKWKEKGRIRTRMKVGHFSLSLSFPPKLEW